MQTEVDSREEPYPVSDFRGTIERIAGGDIRWRVYGHLSIDFGDWVKQGTLSVNENNVRMDELSDWVSGKGSVPEWLDEPKVLAALQAREIDVSEILERETK